MALLTAAGRTVTQKKGETALGQNNINPGSSVPQSIFNLVKNVVGAGVLSLPSGLAAGTGLVPASVIVVALGLYSMGTFALIGRMCAANKAFTFLGLGESTKGKGFARLMAATCTLKTFFTCLAYSLVIADSFSTLFEGFHHGPFAGDREVMRPRVLLTITALVILPLCLLRDLSMLSYTSLLGSGGLLYTLGFMALRLQDGSYLPNGRFYESVKPALRRDFSAAPEHYRLDPVNTPILVCLLSTAFIAHYNAPRFYEQLKDRSVTRFEVVVGTSFTIALLFFLGFMVVGYLTFGSHANGNILNNYSSLDPMASVARVAVGASVVLTYPLAFTGLRDGVISLLQGTGRDDEGASEMPVGRTSLTLMLLFSITGLALVITDVGFVNALGGAIFGAAIIYCFPALILIFYRQQAPPGSVSGAAYLFGIVTVPFGVSLALVGAFFTVAKRYFPELLMPAPPTGSVHVI